MTSAKTSLHFIFNRENILLKVFSAEGLAIECNFNKTNIYQKIKVLSFSYNSLKHNIKRHLDV